ncbi:MAG: UV-endonuclease UvdE [Myxococcales bacterium]|nr:UV-endonuclease UvdE [Myxococcales bacterium]
MQTRSRARVRASSTGVRSWVSYASTMVRLGLCCTFLSEPIKFRTTTVRYSSTLTPEDRRGLLNSLARHNVAALRCAIAWCAANGVGAFRVQSGLLPLYTHPTAGWKLGGAIGAGIADGLRAAGADARRLGVRLSFHPDQFVVPGSVNPSTVKASLAELEYMGEVAALVGGEQITIHGGGAHGGKQVSLDRLAQGLGRLSPRARDRVVLENDDRLYTVEDLLPVCERLSIPLVYDVHHHRCNPDRLDVERATELAAETWGGREPWVHLSSPAQGWRSGDPRPHADYIDTADVPRSWLDRTLTIDVEAKAKELAVVELQTWVTARDRTRSRRAAAAVERHGPRRR